MAYLKEIQKKILIETRQRGYVPFELHKERENQYSIPICVIYENYVSILLIKMGKKGNQTSSLMKA